MASARGGSKWALWWMHVDRLPKTMRNEWNEITQRYQIWTFRIERSTCVCVWHCVVFIGVWLCFLFTYCNVPIWYLLFRFNFVDFTKFCREHPVDAVTKANAIRSRVRTLNIMIVLYCQSVPWRWHIRTTIPLYCVDFPYRNDSLLFRYYWIRYETDTSHFAWTNHFIFTLFSALNLLDMR